jgi:hypothetical protein
MPDRRRFLTTAVAVFLTFAILAGWTTAWSQPVESESGLVLVQAGRQARVERPSGEAERVPLRPRERMTALAETRDGWLAAGARERRGRIQVALVESGGGGTRRLRPPPAQQGLFRIRPVPLIEDGRLAGLAWLEGDSPRAASVRVATWTGADWEPTETVSPPGPGSQTGLAGAVLADGTWMLVWSRFDGRDDELYVSRRRGASWDEPRRLFADNSGPDITPSLIATRNGALLAWSRLADGAYRVELARLEGNRWQPLGAVAAPGSLYPRFARREGREFLVYRDGGRGGWAVLETDHRARVVRRAAIADSPRERPALAQANDGGVTLRFPAASIEASWEIAP